MRTGDVSLWVLGALGHQRVAIAAPSQAGAQAWAVWGSSCTDSPAVRDSV